MADENVIKQNRMTIWFQANGPGTPWKPLALGKSSATGRTKPGPTVSAVYGTDRYGNPRVLFMQVDPPGGLPGMTIGHYEEAAVSFLEQKQAEGCPINIQIRMTECGAIDNPLLWDFIDVNARGRVGDITPGDGPVTPYAGGVAETSGAVTFEFAYRLVRTFLSALTSGIALDINDIVVLTDASCGDCGNGYPGADKIMYLLPVADTGVAAAILYSRDGGSTFQAVSADPFGADEDVSKGVWNWIAFDKFRLLVGNGTAGAGNLEIAYADVTLGDEGTTVWTNVLSTSGDAATGETVAALFWPTIDRLYVASSAGEIFLSPDQGETLAADALFQGANAIAAFAADYNLKYTYAVGAANTILRETDQNGTFVARVGPSGGGAFTAITVAGDGVVFAGNGTSLYKSINGGANTGGWTALKNFGAAHVVKRIVLGGGLQARGGDSETIRVWVDDTTPDDGEVWESVDGGATWRQIPEVANTGYNAAVGSEVDSNKMWGVGDGGAVHILTP